MMKMIIIDTNLNIKIIYQKKTKKNKKNQKMKMSKIQMIALIRKKIRQKQIILRIII